MIAMNSPIAIVIHKIADDKIVSTLREEKNSNSTDQNFASGQITASEESRWRYIWENYNVNRLCLNYSHLTVEQESIIIEEVPLQGHKSNTCSSTHGYDYSKFARLNFPTLIRCQNCETNFPTKYQYQRHQCDYDSSKVPYQDSSGAHNREAQRSNNGDTYSCLMCSKIFLNEVNLERHQLIHLNNNTLSESNVCEFCGKHFVTDNRLRIHKENHCKKAGDISKFYRSDVTVWKCRRCHEVFSSIENANNHVPFCQESSIADVLASGFLRTQKDAMNKEGQDDGKYVNEDEEYLEDNPFPLKQNVGDSIETISTELLLQCEFCNRTFSNKNLLLMHQRKHTTAKNYECITCSKIFDSYTLAASHWLKRCSDFSNVFFLPKLLYCEYCDRTFKSHELLYNHKVKKKHYTPKLHFGVNLGGVAETTYNIENTENRQGSDNKDIINRLIRDVLQTLEVPITSPEGEAEVGEVTMNGQVIKTEPPDNETDKMNCEEEILLPEDLSKKPSVAPPPPPTPVKKRKSKPTLNKNKKPCNTTDDGFRYQCERCIKVFSLVSSLEVHRSTEHVATFCCEECGQTVGSAKALLIHCRAHKCLKPYVCDTCGRSYSQTSHLWQHMRFHQGIKPFACPHEGCEARYTIRPDLKDHIRKVHTRERPFKCNVCNKCFLTGSVYYQHRLIHTNDRRYGCEVCKKRFFRADALNNHKRIHTDERPYPCNVCGREFRQKGDRNKHIRTQHPDHYNMNI